MACSEHCFQPPLPSAPLDSSGCVERWDELQVYVTSPPSSTATSAVVLVSDVFGWKNPLFRKLADKVAAAGFLVVVPDLLYDDPYDPVRTENRQEWLAKHHPEGKPMDDFKKIVHMLQMKGIMAIGVAGFCWGAKIAINSRGSSIKAVVLLHPSRVTAEEVKAVQVPTAVLAAEIDELTPAHVVEEFQRILKNKAGVEHFVKIYPGVQHGWTVRYDPSDEQVTKQAEAAHHDMISWFQMCMQGSA